MGGVRAGARRVARWELDEAVAHAERAIQIGSSSNERRVSWRACRVAAEALRRLGREAEADPPRERAVALIEAEAASLSPEHRGAFFARRDVAELLSFP